MKSTFFSLMIAILSFASCKKSSTSGSSNSCTLSDSSILGSYKITSVVLSVANQTIDMTNNDSYRPLCERDDIYTLNADGTYTITDGVNVSSPSSADSGTWTLNGNTFTLDGTQVSTISDFTCTSFKYTMTGNTVGEIIATTVSRQ